MRKVIPAILFLVFCAQSAISADLWMGADRSNWKQTEYRKVVQDFGGNLVVTADENWREKWDTPPEEIVYFAPASEVVLGEKLWILIFYVNPLLDSERRASVLCDIKVVRADDSVSYSQTDLPCFQGELQGDLNNVRLSAPIIEYVGESGDPLGVWKVHVNLKDTLRGVALDLMTQFSLVERDA